MLAHKLEELDEQLQSDSFEMSQGEVTERFRIDNLESADWALRKIAINNQELQEKEELFAKYEAWIKAEREKTANNNSYFECLLYDYHTRVLEENPKAKTISAPHGKIKATTRKPAIVKPEEECLPQIIEYAEQNGFSLLVEEKKTLKWAEFKKELQLKTVNGKQIVVDSNGQIVEGIPLSEGGTTFKITTE